MKKAILPIILPILIGLLLPTCTSDEEDGKDCPSFHDFQIYPMEGGPATHFELFVELQNKSQNRKVERVYAVLLTSDGRQTGDNFDLVESDSDPKRFLRTFLGSDLCAEGICNLFFKVYAKHASGCIRGFDTDIFQIVTPGAADDTADDTADDSGDDAADDASDDTASDDSADDTAD